MPQLDTTWFPSQFFWLFICFTVLYFGVKSVLPVLEKIFTDRNKMIEENIKVASELRDEARKVIKAYEEGIVSARDKSDIIMQNTKQEINDYIKEKEAEFEKKSTDVLARSHENLEQASKEAILDVKKMASDLTMMIYSKVTNKDILKEQIEDAVNNIIEEQQKQ